MLWLSPVDQKSTSTTLRWASSFARDTGWPSIETPFEIAEPEGSISLPLSLEPPPGIGAGLYQASVAAVLMTDGAEIDPTPVVRTRAMPVVEYPHIRPTAVPREARVSIRILDVELPQLDLVGYIPGASDRVPQVLEQIGLPIHIMDRSELEHGDLDSFDAIVVGSRAYEIDAALGRANGRLLEYARRGGTLLVQYQQYQFVLGGYAPFPLEIARPHGRVTDETAPVRILGPDHPVFRRPNRIDVADWEGWVQERGLYFADSWDDRYTPLLAMADAGRSEERGALLVAPLGKGTYIYTGLSFFRELPAGVPGALRLFVNLLGARS